MLRAYPRAFRLEYGPEMTQLFRDCYRDTHADGLITALAFWQRMIVDVIRTAPLERWEALERRCETMKNLKTDVLGLLACLAIIAVAFVLFGVIRTTSIAIVDYALDAIITAGIVSNVIIFLLALTTRLRSFQVALRTLVIVHIGLLLIATSLGLRVDPRFSFLAVLVAYIISFIFWLGVHRLRSQLSASPVTSG
jgi:hypothetical protein